MARGTTRRPQLPAPGSLDEAVADYLAHIETRGYSEGTVVARAYALSLFTAWLKERGVTTPTEVIRPIVERYQRHLFLARKKDGQPLSFRTQHHRLNPVILLFSFLAKEHRVLYNPAAEIDLPRVERRLPRYTLTAQEAETVIATCDVTTPVGVRDRAILETFYSTGMRRFELCRLELYDLDVERETVLVREGKGRRDRLIPIGERAVAWVVRYLNDVRPRLVRGTFPVLFLTADGDAFAKGHLTSLVARYVEASGIPKKGSCHLFRHTMATLMLEGGADIRFIQEMLGHAELSTTQIYTKVSIQKLKAVHTATHPGATNTRHRSLLPEDDEDPSSS